MISGKKKTLVTMTAALSLIAGLSITAAAKSVSLNETNFPDDAFRDHLSKNFDTDKDSVLSTKELKNIKVLDLTYNGDPGIEQVSDLTGISNLSSLTALLAANNNIKTLDVSANTALSDINVSNNTLTSIEFGSLTSLKTLDLSLNYLTHVRIPDGNSLTSANLSNNLGYADVVEDLSLSIDEVEGLEEGRMSGITGGELIEGSLIFDSDAVSYNYDCGSGISAGFVIQRVKTPHIKEIYSFYKGFDISWEKTPGASKYEIYRKVGENGVFQKIAEVNSKRRNYIDQNRLKNNKVYYYSVVAVTIDGANEIRSVMNMRGLPCKARAVKLKSVTKTSSGRLVKWKTIKGAAGYRIYKIYSKNPRSYYYVGRVGSGSTSSFTDKTTSKSCDNEYFVVPTFPDGSFGVKSNGIKVVY